MEIKKEAIKYIDNNKEKGIIIDWIKAHKYFNKLTYSKTKYNANKVPFYRFDIFWHCLLSERGTGKTTMLVLLGMILNKMYGSQIAYFRQFKDETTKKYYDELFNVILDYDYIEQITDGVYNSIHVDRQKRAFYCLRDEMGKMIECAEVPFLYILAIENAMGSKSSFNAPHINLLIFDEFASDKYINGEYSGFELFHTWISTITRERLDFKIFMLSNTLNPYNKYLDELNVSQRIIEMKKGQTNIIDGGLGALVYTELIDNEVTEAVKDSILKRALMIHGFKNPKLKSIYSGSWTVRNYPHLWRDELTRIDDGNIFIECMGSFMNLEAWDVGDDIVLNMSMSYRNVTTVKSDAIILSDVYACTNKRIYGMNKLIKRIHDYEVTGKLYFSDNGCGLLWDTFKNNLRNIH